MSAPETFASDEAVINYLTAQMHPRTNTGQIQVWVHRPLTEALRSAIIGFTVADGLTFRFFQDEKSRPGQFHVTLTRPMPHLPKPHQNRS